MATAQPTGKTASKKIPTACVRDRLLEVAAVLKSLLVLKETKGLSFREKKMLERARYLLVSELAMARNTEEANVEEILDKALSKTNLKFPDAAELQS